MMVIEVWILGEIIDEGSEEESSTWNLFGIFFSRDDALHAFERIHANRPERFFVAPVNAGEVLWDDITKYPGFAVLKQK
jgi:hypothetical protein